MPFCPNSSSYPKKLSSEYQLYACGNFFWHSSILNKIAILGQPPRVNDRLQNREFRPDNRKGYKEVLCLKKIQMNLIQ